MPAPEPEPETTTASEMRPSAELAPEPESVPSEDSKSEPGASPGQPAGMRAAQCASAAALRPPEGLSRWHTI